MNTWTGRWFSFALAGTLPSQASQWQNLVMILLTLFFLVPNDINEYAILVDIFDSTYKFT
jgi:hypothetical protein